ncbi:hypothetical protein FYJ24_00625 [Actinomycetaceae bacterium WB03_NA08]|uniref:Uncharacterized protein n=1 Tax=Scrofimicrobium canadense TaxID=2652290 RepID=A0A6N7W4B2_9ACTO|nr:hypothetical protein [Scrofimicrobium canadense]MSS83292.1 hypothetical protein [Scrofimicrobium canadense]
MTVSVHEACASLRFAEGLRRRSAQARAEAAVQEAVSLSSLLGVRVAASEIREATVRGDFDEDPRLAAALGVWRAAWSLEESLDPLNPKGPRRRTATPPWPATIAQWHRDICSFLVARSHMSSQEVAKPLSLEAIRVIQEPNKDALTHAAKVWRTFVVAPPFTYGSAVVGALAAKRILALSGVEPTGVAVIGSYAAQDPSRFFSLDDREEEWQQFTETSVIEGCQRGIEVSRWVQAERLPS